VLIVDANIIVAAMNRRDKHHKRMKVFLDGRDDQFVVTGYVVAEVAYLVHSRPEPAHQRSYRRRTTPDPSAQLPA
jgi:predicted nucleic acid-binding protein